MRPLLLSAAASAALLLGGCVTLLGPPLGSELVGHSARLAPIRGQPSTLHFGPNGAVRSVFGRGQANGRWWVRGKRLCFLWAGTQECWPYRRALRPGETRMIRSDRGNLVQVTLR